MAADSVVEDVKARLGARVARSPLIYRAVLMLERGDAIVPLLTELALALDEARESLQKDLEDCLMGMAPAPLVVLRCPYCEQRYAEADK